MNSRERRQSRQRRSQAREPQKKELFAVLCEGPKYLELVVDYNFKFLNAFRLAIPETDRKYDGRMWTISKPWKPTIIELCSSHFDRFIDRDALAPSRAVRRSPLQPLVEIIELLPLETQQEVAKKIYRAAALCWHPDINKADAATKVMWEIDKLWTEAQEPLGFVTNAQSK